MSLVARRQADGLGRAGRLAVGLAVIVGARWFATGAGVDGVVVGACFGSALLALAVAGGWRPGAARAAPALVGLGGGLLLVGLALLLRRPGPDLVGHPAPFVGWLAATVLVATAEEVLLRGALLASMATAAGPVVAVATAAVAFALMHVPTYGWSVVPLDLGVGLWLGGLRLLSGGLAAPAVAHVVADLATWWF